jgi:ADP-ribose pyrophosphatase YjhB (NUDIX family)
LPQTRPHRKTSRGIVLHDGAVLLIERWRTDDSGKKLHYFSVPGGKIETGETPEVAVVRELFEEASLLIRPIKLLAKQSFKDDSSNMYFLCEYLSGAPELHASMPEHQSDKNRSHPRWVGEVELANLKLNEVYEPVRKLIGAIFAGKIPEVPLRLK